MSRKRAGRCWNAGETLRAVLAAACLLCLATAAGVKPPLQAEDSLDALAMLRGIENARLSTRPFRLTGTITRDRTGTEWNCRFTVECEGEKYRITRMLPNGGIGAVAIFDGEKLFCYDGKESAIINTPDQRATSCMAFDPRALALSTGLYSDLTLQKNLAYESATDIVVVPTKAGIDGTEIAQIELTDRFSQRIRIDVERRAPFRVRYYSKTIALQDGTGVFARYVTASEYWPDDGQSWIPRQLTMYSLRGGDPNQRYDNAVVQFEKPEFVSGFDPEIWTEKGLSMPFGQPVADLRIKQRVGYWNGKQLVESPPLFETDSTAEPAKGQPADRPIMTWLVITNLAALAVLSVYFWRRRTPHRGS